VWTFVPLRPGYVVLKIQSVDRLRPGAFAALFAVKLCFTVRLELALRLCRRAPETGCTAAIEK
jgi:hypothetical protein